MQASTDIVKNCIHHGALKIDQVVKSGIRNGAQVYKCLRCKRQTYKNNYAKNRDQILARLRSNKERDPEKRRRQKNESQARRYKIHKAERDESPFSVRLDWYEKTRKLWRERNERHVRDLPDTYIKELITKRTKITHAEITPEMCDIKRIGIQIKRTIKLLQQEHYIDDKIKKYESDEHTGIAGSNAGDTE